MFNNDKKTVLVTGASGGIGKEISIRFAENNWNILCHYHSSDKKVDGMIKYFDDCKFDYRFINADFSDPESLNGFISELDNFRIDSLINNAGKHIVNDHSSSDDLPDITNLFMVNVFSAVLLTSNIFKKMKNSGFGRIVNISSIGAKYGSPVNAVSYGCSKAALEAAAKSFAKEGADCNVLVNTVRPGVIDTDTHKYSGTDMKKRISLIPLRRMGDPLEVAEMVYYLGSDRNSFITNDIVTVSGGE